MADTLKIWRVSDFPCRGRLEFELHGERFREVSEFSDICGGYMAFYLDGREVRRIHVSHRVVDLWRGDMTRILNQRLVLKLWAKMYRKRTPGEL